jgi:hypothetical protein
MVRGLCARVTELALFVVDGHAGDEEASRGGEL